MVQKPLDMFQVELDKRFSFKMMDGELAEAALRELEKALTNYQSAEAVSCCGPMRSCRHRTRWVAMHKKNNISKCSFPKKEHFKMCLS